MKVGERLNVWFSANPIAWILFLFLAVSIYGNYNAHRRLDAVCEDFGDMTSEAPLNVPYASFATWQKIEYGEVQNIYGSELSDPQPINP